jgi:hypothetical protein
MDVDRVHRDAAAAALAALLRGELDAEATRARFAAIHSDLSEAATQDAYLAELLKASGYWTLEPRTENAWAMLCRHLAFLRSDLPRPKTEFANAESDAPREVYLARLHTVGLVVAAVLSFWLTWWIFAAVTVISFVSFQISMERRERARKGDVRRLTAFYPFADESDWLAHKTLVEDGLISGYDPSRYRMPMFRRLGSLVLTAVFLSAIAAMFVAMELFSILMWPLWLILVATLGHLEKRSAPAMNSGSPDHGS